MAAPRPPPWAAARRPRQETFTSLTAPVQATARCALCPLRSTLPSWWVLWQRPLFITYIASATAMLLYRVDWNIAYCHRPQVEQVTVFCSDGDLPFEQSAPLCFFLECASASYWQLGETGCNSNTFCFGNSGTETIWDTRLLFTCVQTLVIWLYSSCKNIWKCQHQVVEIRLWKNDYRCYNRPRMPGQL